MKQPTRKATAMKFTTEYKTDAKGAGRITAKGGGKQRTVPYDHSMSIEANHASAAGVVANLVLNAEQQAKVFHPSFRNAWSMEAPENGKRVIVLPV